MITPNFSDVQAHTNAFFGSGDVPVRLVGGFQCNATVEGNITDCPHTTSPDCIHGRYAGVSCKLANCTDEDLRLVFGRSEYEGNVEVCINESWAAICDSQWSNVEAAVVCRQMGYSATGMTHSGTIVTSNCS